MTREEGYRLAMRACDITWNEKTCEQIREALEQQPCEDAVSRQAVINCVTSNEFRYKIVEDIKTLPPVIPKEKTGHWIALDECSNSGYYCSECHKKVIKEGWSDTIKKINYCPNCGARMVELRESEGIRNEGNN